MTKAGNVIAWEYFHPNEEIPHLFLIVQDYDLWQFKYPETKAVALHLKSIDNIGDFKFWDKMCTYQADYIEFVKTGYILERIQKSRIEKFKKSTDKYSICKLLSASDDGGVYNIAFYNTTNDINELAEAFYRDEEDIDISISYFITGYGDVIFSFRSNKVDVSVFAKRLGGGGHTSSAGAAVELIKALNIIHNATNSKCIYL